MFRIQSESHKITVGTSWQWSGPSSYNSTLQDPTINGVTLARARDLHGNCKDDKGCTASASTSDRSIVAMIDVLASSNSPQCEGSQLNLSATSISGATYSWSGPNGFAASVRQPSIDPVGLAATGKYTVSVTTTSCGLITATTDVVINPSPTMSGIINPSVCRGTTSANLTYSSTTGDPDLYSINFDRNCKQGRFSDIYDDPLK